MAGLRIINIKTGEDSAVNGGGSGSGQIPANVVTRDDIFDSNGKIRADVIDVSIDGQSLSLKEDSSNKVATIDSSSTHTQYPSAKAVYDVLASAIGAIDVSIDPASLEGKEDSSNKVTVIDSSSTDEQYPSAKAVYDALVESKNVIFCSDSEFWGLDPDESTLYIVKKTLTPTFGGYAISPLIQYRDGKNTFSEKYFNYEKYLEIEATADSEGWSDKEMEDAFNNITLDYENVDFSKRGKVEGSYYLSYSEGGGHGFSIDMDGECCWWGGLNVYDFYYNILSNRTGSTLAWNDGNSTVETPNVLYAHARIDGKKHGLLLFPDNFWISYRGDNNLIVNFLRLPNGAEYQNEITREDLIYLLSQGCEFIPAMGYIIDNNNYYTNLDSELCLLTGSYYSATGQPVVFDWDCYQKDIPYSGVAKDKDSFRTISKFFSKNAIKVIYNLYLGRKLVFSTHKDEESSSETGDKIVCLTRAEYNTLVENEEIDPDKFYVVEDKGASFGGLAIAPTQLVYDGNKLYIPEFGEDVDTGSGEELPTIEIDPPLTSSGSTSLYDYACINSAGTKYGKTAGSTYFTPQTDLVNELVNPDAQTADGVFIPISSLGYDDWKIMSGDDFRKIFDPESRPGATVNGNENCLYAFVYASEGGGVEPLSASDPNSGNDGNRFGVLIFPDGVNIEGATLDNFNYNENNVDNSGAAYAVNGNAQFATWISPEDINDYISQGCVFIPMLGSAYSADNEISWDDSWAPILTFNGIYHFNEYGFNINGTSSDAWEEYIPIRLVSKKAAESGSKSVYLGDILITGERVTESSFVFVTRAEYEVLGSNINPNKFYVVEDGAAGGDTAAKFGDIEVAPTQLMWSEDRGGFFIPTLDEALEIANSGGGSEPIMQNAEPTELWNNLYMYSVINSNGDYVGREDRSTYFSYNELGQFFSSAGDSFDGESDIDNKGGKVTFNGKSWRLPTKEEMRALFDSTKRTGATVDGIANACWAPAYISFTSGDDDSIVESDMFNENDYLAIVVFPDDVEIDAASMNIKFNKINPTEEESRYEPQPKGHEVYTELNSIQLGYLLSKGCLILPMLGFYQENSGDGGIKNAEDVPDGWWASILDGKGLYMTATKDYCYYINGSTDIYDDDAYAYFENNGCDTTPIWGTVRLVAEAAGNQSYKVYKNGQLIFDSNNTSGSNESVAEIKNELKNKVDGEILTPEEYEGLVESGEINSDKIYFVGYKAMPSFGGVAIAPAQYVHYMNIGGTYHIGRDDESEYNYSTYGYQYNNSRNTTYFSFSSLTQVFDYRAENIIDSSNQITRPLDNKITSYNSSKIETVYNNYGDWRLPTKDDLERIFGDERHGSYIKCGSDEAQNVQYAPVWIQFGEYDLYFYDNGNPLFAYILFPDDVMIDVSNDILERTFDNRALMRSDVEFWLSNGCVILPALGFYENYNTASSFGEVGLYMFTGDVNGNVAFMISDASSGLCYVDPSSVLGTVRLVSERAAVGEFKIYKGVTPLFSYNDIESSIDDKINGEFLDFEDFSLKDECGELDSNSIYIVSEQTGDLPSFGGISLSQGPLYVDSNGNFAIDTDNPFRNSFGTLKGTVEDSTFFRIIDLMPYFNTDSDTLYDRCIDNGNNRVSAYGYNDWRVPTYEDFNDKIFSSSRNGSIVNGFYNCRWAVVSIENDCRAALVVFPDDRIIRIDGIDNISNTMNMSLISSNGVSLSNICTITMNQAKLFISQGCVILPVYGDYDFSRVGSWCPIYDGQAANGLYMTGSVSGGVGNIMALSLYTDNNVFRPRLSSHSGTYSTSAYGMVHLVSDDACRKNINIYKGRELVLGNKIDEIKPSSTVDELPSAKAVYRYVNEKLRDIENLLSQI